MVPAAHPHRLSPSLPPPPQTQTAHGTAQLVIQRRHPCACWRAAPGSPPPARQQKPAWQPPSTACCVALSQSLPGVLDRPLRRGTVRLDSTRGHPRGDASRTERHHRTAPQIMHPRARSSPSEDERVARQVRSWRKGGRASARPRRLTDRARQPGPCLRPYTYTDRRLLLGASIGT